MFTANVKYPVILAFISLLLYVNTLQNGYAIDDGEVITYNKFVARGINAIPELLTTTRLKGYGTIANDNYRPLSLVTFAIEHQFWGKTPVSGHLFNILFFAACVVTLYLFLSRLFRNNRVAFLAALLFAVHPIHTEVVANIKSRDELLCFLFAFMALNAFLRFAEKGKPIQLIAGTLLLFLSYLSKETVVSFVILMPVVFFFYANDNKKRSWLILSGMIVATTSFFLLRQMIMTDAGNAIIVFKSNPLVSAPDAASRVATALLGLGLYLKLLFVPYPLICDYSYNTIPITSFDDILVLTSTTVYMVITVIAIYRLFKKSKDPWAFGLLFYLITIALFSNIAFLVFSQFAERFLFLPSAGFCLLVSLAMERWLVEKQAPAESFVVWRQPLLAGILIPIALLFSYLTFARNKDWKDDYQLSSKDVEKAPGNGWLCYNVGNALITTRLDNERDEPTRKQIIDEATGYLRTSAGAYPEDVNAHAQLSYAYTLRAKYDSARAEAVIALKLNPDNVNAMNSLAAFYFANKEFAKAALCFKRALVLKPDNVSEFGNIAGCYFNLNQYDSSIVYYRKSLQFNPGNKIPLGSIALAFNAMGLNDSAIMYEQITRQYYPAFRLPMHP